ncbi:MAG: UDP-N-acetylenolpyruvoylglucosamine reductase [Deltaproteobacteria bacterium]|nr:MAG: UDP-N-acetylenolpyruvoylglucosamine reductase [Deltaproteobacteria bacterium]
MDSGREDTQRDTMKKVIEELKRLGCYYLQNFPMDRYTSLRVGGVADLIVYPRNHLQFVQVLNLLSSVAVPWMVLGGGSNTLVHDEGIQGVVVSTKMMRGIEVLDDGVVVAEAGAVLGSILNMSIRAGLSGFEFAAGIPGTVGGGVFMNAGANGGEIKDVVERVWVWLEGREVVLSRDEIKFEYRKSHLPEGGIVTKATFVLKPGDREEIKRRVKDYLERRSKTQPITMSNCGSVFKNPPEIPAGKLLDELGFKGFRIGGAKFSEIHANFIVNLANARASDVLALIDIAREEALKRRGIELEPEIKIVGKVKD